MIEDHIYLYETGTNKAEAQSWYIYIYMKIELKQGRESSKIYAKLGIKNRVMA